MLCLFTVATSASAECACVRWERHTIDRGAVSLHGNRSEPSALACQTATIREARLWVYNTPPHETRLFHGPRVEIRMGSETVTHASGFPNSWTRVGGKMHGHGARARVPANRQAVDRLDDVPEATIRNPGETENTKGATP